MKIAVVKKITKKNVALFKKDCIDSVIYCQIDSDVDFKKLSETFKLINAYSDIANVNWFNFKLITTKLNQVRNKIPGIFQYNGIDLFKALNKDLMWSLLADHSLLYEVEKLKSPENRFVFYDKKNSLDRKLSLFKNIFLSKQPTYSFNLEGYNEDRSRKIAFRMNSAELMALYGNLLTELGQLNLISFQSGVSKHNIELEKKLLENFSENISNNILNKKHLKLKLINKIKLFFIDESPEFIITMFYLLNNLANHVNEYNRLFNSGIKKIILNAGENEGEGNVVCAVAKKYSGITFNYMNGAKAKDPQNVETFFDYWFMPDEKTQNLIASYCNVSKKQLPITGHLLREVQTAYQYSGTMDSYINAHKGKKIIALFTSKIFVGERNEVIEFLVEYLKTHDDVLVLIRKHPSEQEYMLPPHERIIQLPQLKGNLSQASLLDLFLKSDVTISFSSTISSQASWFNVPSINYELSETSRLPFVDNETIFHVNSIKGVEEKLNKYLYNWNKPKVDTQSISSSKKMATIMLNA